VPRRHLGQAPRLPLRRHRGLADVAQEPVQRAGTHPELGADEQEVTLELVPPRVGQVLRRAVAASMSAGSAAGGMPMSIGASPPPPGVTLPPSAEDGRDLHHLRAITARRLPAPVGSACARPTPCR
jgi:hypothetical protein